MKLFTSTLFMFLGLVSINLQAQEPDPLAAQQHAAASDASSAHQPRRWTSANRQEMAREYIRVRAQEKAQARRDRIEGMRDMGFSPQRPTVNALPMMSHPPTWSVSTIGAYSVWSSYYHPMNVAPYMFQ